MLIDAAAGGILHAAEFSPAGEAGGGRTEWMVGAPKAELGDLMRVHDFDYLQRIEAVCARLPPSPYAIGHLDGDTAVSRESWEAALRAAGAVSGRGGGGGWWVFGDGGKGREWSRSLVPVVGSSLTHTHMYIQTNDTKRRAGVRGSGPRAAGEEPQRLLRRPPARYVLVVVICMPWTDGPITQIKFTTRPRSPPHPNPPHTGHHAGSRGVVKCDPTDQGSHGFCLINNVAVAASYARHVYRHQGVKRVAIVDFDVHHGACTVTLVVWGSLGWM